MNRTAFQLLFFILSSLLVWNCQEDPAESDIPEMGPMETTEFCSGQDLSNYFQLSPEYGIQGVYGDQEREFWIQFTDIQKSQTDSCTYEVSGFDMLGTTITAFSGTLTIQQLAYRWLPDSMSYQLEIECDLILSEDPAASGAGEVSGLFAAFVEYDLSGVALVFKHDGIGVWKSYSTDRSHDFIVSGSIEPTVSPNWWQTDSPSPSDEPTFSGSGILEAYPDQAAWIMDRSKLDSIPLVEYEEQLSAQFKGSTNNHTYDLRLEAIPFDTTGHVIENGTLDGVRAYGFHEVLPGMEFTELGIKLTIDETEISIDPKSWPTYFFPNFWQNAQLYEAPDGIHLFLYMTFSDGAYFYAVKFILGPEGYIADLLGDGCGYGYLDDMEDDCM
ncbi:hypothetical protein [Pontibacter sp. G13]|uniref:hypothetical protein n=1 Tax=Pontibacter sp. G13 TaxID=3074898 RepID=UPI00288B2D99|nr:hypothetical protein [Pontibacter sp. G13]WNJ20867.1 hypothetical protein RJD25_10345 [Pontibacter sp. G13]